MANESDERLRGRSGSELATRGGRLLAFVIDGLIGAPFSLVFAYVTGYWDMLKAMHDSGATQLPVGYMLEIELVGFALFAAIQFVPLRATGQTWGKRVAGIKIVDTSGKKPSIKKLLGVRELSKQFLLFVQFIPGLHVFGLILGWVQMLLIFRADSRCGHDLIAGTEVVKAR